MGLRLSPGEAATRGLITKSDAQEMERQARAGRNQIPIVKGMPQRETPPPPKAKLSLAAKQLSDKKREGNEIPQRRLFDAVRVHLPEAQWEREGLIPSRRYRADVFIPPNIILELDGYGFHKSKEAFQKDRLRSNIFTQHGFRVFRAFTKQCLDDTLLAELVELIVDAHRNPMSANVQ
ncbi:hypothetical protein HX878_31635 [Pseudomonas veronii]|uniref:hypothetical protein n=1 Tax=Pseudomonas veronii TaxID=76761 RepID=UPI0015A1D605|nr:hypothetical protein [Pseudomonas veronii]NWD59263.1 hypothetical protein [Pseudomonas veronii]